MLLPSSLQPNTVITFYLMQKSSVKGQGAARGEVLIGFVGFV